MGLMTWVRAPFIFLLVQIKDQRKGQFQQPILTIFFDNFASELPRFVEGELDIKYFNKNSLLKGLQIELDTDFDVFRGKAKGLDKNGALLIELKPGMIQPFYAGSVISWT